MTPDSLISTKDAAAYLAVSPWTVADLARRGIG